jgi:hypothetical protein
MQAKIKNKEICKSNIDAAHRYSNRHDDIGEGKKKTCTVAMIEIDTVEVN